MTKKSSKKPKKIEEKENKSPTIQQVRRKIEDILLEREQKQYLDL